MIDDGDNTYGGKYVVNPSGGLISKGHPLGATGLAQCAELCWQVSGRAGGWHRRHAGHVVLTSAGFSRGDSGHPGLCVCFEQASDACRKSRIGTGEGDKMRTRLR